MTQAIAARDAHGRPGHPRRTPSARRLRNLAFLSPWLLGTGLFFLYPLVATAYFSFTHYDGFTAPRWTGLQNWASCSTTTRSSGRRCGTRCGWSSWS